MSEQVEQETKEEPRNQDDNEKTESENQEEEELTDEERIEQLKEERDEYKEKYLRKSADLKNLRERKEKERKEYMKFANKSLLKDLLEVIDNLERALDSNEKSEEGEGLKEGVEMIFNQLHELLENYDVEKIDAEGEPFDPHMHEGMMREEMDDLDEQKVLEVFQEGYKLHDRVLRPAQVKVGVPSSKQDDS